jgi:hypothetical protein
MKEIDWNETERLRAAILERHDRARASVLAAAFVVNVALKNHPALRDLDASLKELKAAEDAFNAIGVEIRKELRRCERPSCRRTFHPRSPKQVYHDANCKRRHWEERRREGAPTEKYKEPSAQPGPEWSIGPLSTFEE